MSIHLLGAINIDGDVGGMKQPEGTTRRQRQGNVALCIVVRMQCKYFTRIMLIFASIFFFAIKLNSPFYSES